MQSQTSRVVKAPNTLLSVKGEKIKNFKDPEIGKLIENMIEIMHEEVFPGTLNVGIAAHQIGFPLQVCIVEVDDFFEVLINPKITSFSRDTNVMDEGCMSVPGKYLPVERFQSIQIRYENRNGEKKKLRASGFLSRVVQHEIDHLNGILILDRNKKKCHKETLNNKIS